MREQQKILIIDDNELLLKVLVRLLDRAGYAAIPWDFSSDVLGTVRYHQPHLLILDLELGYLSGVQVVEQLRNDPQHATLPIIVYSGNPFVLSPTRARLLQWNCRVLDKQLQLDELTAEVVQALSSSVVP